MDIVFYDVTTFAFQSVEQDDEIFMDYANVTELDDGSEVVLKEKPVLSYFSKRS
jgi:hypothetical protein